MSDFFAGMFGRARAALLPRAPSPPSPPPAERALTPAQRDWLRRLARIAEERAAQDALRREAEQHEAEAFAERQRQAAEEIVEICARNGGYYFPGDHAYPRDRFGMLRQRHPRLARVVEILTGGG